MNDHKDKLGRKSSDSLGFDRVRWSKSHTVETHYDMVENIALALNIAKSNPDYDASVQYDPKNPDSRCEKIVWTRPERAFFLDETELSRIRSLDGYEQLDKIRRTKKKLHFREDRDAGAD